MNFYDVGFTRYDLDPDEEDRAMRLFPMQYELTRSSRVGLSFKPKMLRSYT